MSSVNKILKFCSKIKEKIILQKNLFVNTDSTSQGCNFLNLRLSVIKEVKLPSIDLQFEAENTRAF